MVYFKLLYLLQHSVGLSVKCCTLSPIVTELHGMDLFHASIKSPDFPLSNDVT